MQNLTADQVAAETARPQARGFASMPLSAAAALSTLLSAAGVFAVLSTAIYLYGLWTLDPLKSIGGLMPIVALILILRAWRAIGWEQHGTWWGLALLAFIIALVHIRDHAILEFVLSPSWSIFLPPHSAVAVLYAAGAVLLFGGMPLLRAAWFPVCLMWFVNPVPNFFTLHVDLPLQHASAHIARSFAQALGQPLTPDQLRLMFTPDFGMFIAPGCDGIRGAITMGFIALIAGYIYRFRLRVHVLVVVAAVALGYVFNFIRLCALVLYYIVALHIKWLQSRAEMGDYIIGGCLFLFATTMLFTVILRLNPSGTLRPPALTSVPSDPIGTRTPRSFYFRFAAMLLLVVIGSISYARAMLHPAASDQAIARTPDALGLFPQHLGNYTLGRSWNEHLITGALIFYWADYVSPTLDADGNPTHIAVGISPMLGAHDTLLCHAARGEDWLWHDNLTIDAGHTPTSFSASFFNDGAVQYLEASTICTGATCGQYSTSRQHFGFIYSRPDTTTLLTQSPTRPIPIVLRVETPDASMAPDLARAQLTTQLRAFLANADLSQFTSPYR